MGCKRVRQALRGRYRVIFHPQLPDVCQRVNFRLGVDFAEAPEAHSAVICHKSRLSLEVAFYGNMAQPAKVSDTFDVYVFIQAPHFEACIKTARLSSSCLDHSGNLVGAINSVEEASDTAKRQHRVMYLFVHRGSPPGHVLPHTGQLGEIYMPAKTLCTFCANVVCVRGR
eukprot:1728951-Amphidinium_carterae.1